MHVPQGRGGGRDHRRYEIDRQLHDAPQEEGSGKLLHQTGPGLGGYLLNQQKRGAQLSCRGLLRTRVFRGVRARLLMRTNYGATDEMRDALSHHVE